jgi:Tfp pilus assembly protein FimT
MITLVIVTVLLTLATPAFTALIAENRVRSEVFSLRSMLMEARSEAMTERNNVSVCSSNDGATCSGTWNQGYIAFFDSNADGSINGTDRIVLTRTPDAPSLNVSFIGDSSRVLYNSRGNAQSMVASFNGTFRFCDSNGNSKPTGLIVSPVGTMMAAEDSDDPLDGIPNDHDGVNLVCGG